MWIYSFILKAVETDVVRSQWAGLRDPSLRTAKNRADEPADPSWNAACFTAETHWTNLLEGQDQDVHHRWRTRVTGHQPRMFPWQHESSVSAETKRVNRSKFRLSGFPV